MSHDEKTLLFKKLDNTCDQARLMLFHFISYVAIFSDWIRKIFIKMDYLKIESSFAIEA